MTSEDAIKVLQVEMACVRRSCVRHECAVCDLVMCEKDVLMAYQMAIEALQTDGDCISKQAVIDTATEYEKELCEILGDENELVEVVKILKHRLIALSSVQPEQTDCEYCHEDSDGYVRPIEKNSHAWLVRRGRTMKLRVCFKGGYSECDILFCPMCGRRLTDG